MYMFQTHLCLKRIYLETRLSLLNLIRKNGSFSDLDSFKIGREPGKYRISDNTIHQKSIK